MRVLRRASRRARNRVTRARHRKLAQHSQAVRMEMLRRSSRCPPRLARLRRWFRRKGIWPRVFPFPLKASNPAYLVDPRTEPPAQTVEAAAEPRQGMVAEKIR